MFRSNSRWILSCLAILLIASVAGIAQDAIAPPSADESPIQPSEKDSQDEIVGQCDELEHNDSTGITVMTGHVQIKRKNGYLNADKVTIYRDMKDPAQPVTKTVAEGHVDMKEDAITAVSNTAIFDEVAKTVQLNGSVVVFQKSDRIEAEEVILDRVTGKRTFRGGVKFKVAIRTKQSEPSAEAASADNAGKPSTEPGSGGAQEAADGEGATE